MRFATTLLGLTCAVTACTGSSDVGQPRTSPPQPSATSTSTATGTATCVNRTDGYAVDHPVTWQAGEAAGVEPCRWFSPEPLPAAADQDPAGVPIRLVLVPHPLDDVERLERADSELLSSARHDVEGRPAVRQELRAVGQQALPPGTRTTQWLVDLGGRTLIAGTSETATAGSYAQNVQVLDAMARSLRLVDQQAVECSARDLPAEPQPQAGLPTAVQETRREVYLAAVRCDFDRLQALVPDGGFTYSFGGGDDPAGFWRRAELEQDRHPPMRYLAGLLQRPYATREVQGATHYAWPSAFAYDTWSQVPQADREALRPLYDEQDFAGFQEFGGYVGYRVLVDEDGTWRAFVAGD